MSNTVKTIFTVDGLDEAGRKVDKFKSNIGDTNAIDKAVEAYKNKLKELDARLDKTVSASNKLGDSSATVARRYEKLSESIQLNRQRLIENAQAFEKGEINAKKFSAVLASVDRAALSVSGRIKDANARITEISETGRTHFQNQIAGSVTNQQASGIRGALQSLSSYQKTQLSFQANDIISGLAMGQSPLQILAQQGGQIVQIFQMGKMNATGMATAMQATEEATEGTVTALTAASGATSSMAVSIAAAVAPFAAIAAAGFAVVKLSQDIREAAEKRLATELKITAEWNKQINLAGELQKKRDAAAQDRAGDYFLQTGNVVTLQRERDQLLKEFNEKAKQVADETRNRNALDLGPKYVAGASAAVGYDATKAAEQYKQILDYDAKIDQLQRDAAARGSASERLFAEIRDENLKKSIQAAQKAAQEEIELIRKKDTFALDSVKTLEELKRFQYRTTAQTQTEAFDREVAIARKREELIKAVKQAQETLFDSAISREGKENPFLAFLGSANKEMRTMLETAKVLSPALRQAFTQQLQAGNRDELYKLRLDTQLDAESLRRQAAEFRQGYRNDLSDPQTLQKLIDEQLKTLGLGRRLSSATYAYGARGVGAYLGDIGDNTLQAVTEKQKAYRDQRLLNLAGSADPKLITERQQDAIASAFEREANRKLDYEKNANDYFTAFLGAMGEKGLKVDLGDQALTAVEVKGVSATVTRTSTPGPKKTTAQAMSPVFLNTGRIGT